MRKAINNRGMTLLELIIAMTISVIVIMMIIYFMNGAFRVFQKTNNEVNLQMEAQTAINQLANIAMEAKQYENATEPDRYHIFDVSGKVYGIIFDQPKGNLFLIDLTDPMDATKYIDVDTIIIDEALRKKNLLAEYVDSFSITSVGSNGGIMNITLNLKLGDETYSITKKVNLRNYVTPTP